jgi:hypothetical protein
VGLWTHATKGVRVDATFEVGLKVTLHVNLVLIEHLLSENWVLDEEVGNVEEPHAISLESARYLTEVCTDNGSWLEFFTQLLADNFRLKTVIPVDKFIHPHWLQVSELTEQNVYFVSIILKTLKRLGLYFWLLILMEVLESVYGTILLFEHVSQVTLDYLSSVVLILLHNLNLLQVVTVTEVSN